MAPNGGFDDTTLSIAEQLAVPGSRLRRELAVAVSTVNNVLVSEQQTALTQIWVPKLDEDGNTVLSCQGLPYAISGEGDLLALFRCVSCRYTFRPSSTDASHHGSIGRVYRTHRPEITNDVQNFPKDMYLRVEEAQKCGMHSLCVVPLWMPELSRSSPVAILEVLQPDEQPSFDELMSKVTDSMSKVRVSKVAVQPPLPDPLFDSRSAAHNRAKLELHRGRGLQSTEAAGWRQNVGDERLNMVFGDSMPAAVVRADSSSGIHQGSAEHEEAAERVDSGMCKDLVGGEGMDCDDTRPPETNAQPSRGGAAPPSQPIPMRGATPRSTTPQATSSGSDGGSSGGGGSEPLQRPAAAAGKRSSVSSEPSRLYSATHSAQLPSDADGAPGQRGQEREMLRLPSTCGSSGMEGALDLLEDVARDKSWQKPMCVRPPLGDATQGQRQGCTSDPNDKGALAPSDGAPPPQQQPHTMHAGALMAKGPLDSDFERHLQELNRKRKFQDAPIASSPTSAPRAHQHSLRAAIEAADAAAAAGAADAAVMQQAYATAPAGSNLREAFDRAHHGAAGTSPSSLFGSPPQAAAPRFDADAAAHAYGAGHAGNNASNHGVGVDDRTVRAFGTGDVFHAVRRRSSVHGPASGGTLHDKVLRADTAHLRAAHGRLSVDGARGAAADALTHPAAYARPHSSTHLPLLQQQQQAGWIPLAASQPPAPQLYPSGAAAPAAAYAPGAPHPAAHFPPYDAPYAPGLRPMEYHAATSGAEVPGAPAPHVAAFPGAMFVDPAHQHGGGAPFPPPQHGGAYPPGAMARHPSIASFPIQNFDGSVHLSQHPSRHPSQHAAAYPPALLGGDAAAAQPPAGSLLFGPRATQTALSPDVFADPAVTFPHAAPPASAQLPPPQAAGRASGVASAEPPSSVSGGGNRKPRQAGGGGEKDGALARKRSASVGVSGAVVPGVTTQQGIAKAVRNRINRTDGGIGRKLTLDILKQQFGNGLKEAAENLSMCPTTLKRACRRLGIRQWPRSAQAGAAVFSGPTAAAPPHTHDAAQAPGGAPPGVDGGAGAPAQVPPPPVVPPAGAGDAAAAADVACDPDSMSGLYFDFDNEGPSFSLNFFQDNVMNMLDFNLDEMPTPPVGTEAL